MKQLRNYQQTACDYITEHLERYKKPFVYCLPCGGGKSLVIAEVAKRWGDTLVLTTSKELCEQDLQEMQSQGVDAVAYSASLGSKEVAPVTVATIASAYQCPELFDADLVIIDEAQLVDCSKRNSMFMKLLSAMAHARRGEERQLKVVGLTATPWRNVQRVTRKGRWVSSTTILQPINRIPMQRGFFWSGVSEGMTTREALERGFLTPVEYYQEPVPGKLRVNTNGSDYTEESLEEWGEGALVRCLQVMQGAERVFHARSGIVAVPQISHAEALQAMCRLEKVSSIVVSSKTPQRARNEAITAFKRGDIRWLIQCNIANIGFNSPMTDTLVWARPTLSLGLFYQAVGRVMRLSEGKQTARVFDLAGTLKSFGKVEYVNLGIEDGFKTTIVGSKGKLSGVPLKTFSFQQKRANVKTNETDKEARK